MLECIKLLLHNLKCKEYKWTHSHIWSVMLFEHTSVSIGLGQPWTPLFFHLSGGFYWCTICCSQYTRKQGLGLRGSIHPPTGPDHQISLTQITSKKKKNSLITKKFMYSESVDGCFHAALWSCRECYTCQVYSQPPITNFYRAQVTTVVLVLGNIFQQPPLLCLSLRLHYDSSQKACNRRLKQRSGGYFTIQPCLEPLPATSNYLSFPGVHMG